MPYYIKTRKNVAVILGVERKRCATADGNILLWQADSMLTGEPVLNVAVEKMGGVLLTPVQAKAEVDGELSTPLPEPTDPRFLKPKPEPEPEPQPQPQPQPEQEPSQDEAEAETEPSPDTDPDADPDADTEPQEGADE